MKKHISTIICGIIIIISLIVIIKSVWIMRKNNTPPVSQSATSSEEEKLYTAPLTTIEFDEKLLDAGDLPADTVIYQTYQLKNTGENPLVIYFVKPDCNCTDYEISKPVANPGDSIQIKLQVDMKEKNKGMFMLNTVVRANTKEELYRLRLKGNVLAKNKRDS